MKRGHVLITRPQQDAVMVADQIKGMGYEVFCEPFLQVFFENKPLPNLGQYKELIFTSVNGVRAFCHNSKERSCSIITVGPNTADEAKLNGFSTVKSLNGDADKIVQFLLAQGHDEPYLHVRGAHVTSSLKESLPNVQVEEIILYHTEKIDKISKEVRHFLQSGAFTHVLFFSKRTAESFVEAVRASECGDALQRVFARTKALCLGPSMVECLSVLPWQEMNISSQPDREGMLALLNETSD